MKPQIIDRFVYVKGKKISEVENTGTLHGKELIPVADNNQNFHTTVDQISEYVDNSHDYLTTEDYNDLKSQIDSERTNRQEADNELNQSIQDAKSELHSTISNVESELLNEVNDLQGLIDNINDTGIANGVTLDTVQTITGEKTFTTVPKSTADATEDTDLVNKKYVDDIANASFVFTSEELNSGLQSNRLNECINAYNNNKIFCIQRDNGEKIPAKIKIDTVSDIIVVGYDDVDPEETGEGDELNIYSKVVVFYKSTGEIRNEQNVSFLFSTRYGSNVYLNGNGKYSKPTKETVGLGNVDNTADIDKPVSTATQVWVNEQGFAKTSDIPEGLEIGETTGTAFDGGRGKAVEDTLDALNTDLGLMVMHGAQWSQEQGDLLLNLDQAYRDGVSKDFTDRYIPIIVPTATSEHAGAMSASDKQKLDSLSDSSDVYVIDYITDDSGIITLELYNELKTAIENNKVIVFILYRDIYIATYVDPSSDALTLLTSLNDSNSSCVRVISYGITINSNYEYSVIDKRVLLFTNGVGTKYLSDNGTYKTIEQPDLSNYLTTEDKTELETEIGDLSENVNAQVTALLKKDSTIEGNVTNLTETVDTINTTVSGLDNKYLSLSGGTISGNLTLPSNGKLTVGSESLSSTASVTIYAQDSISVGSKTTINGSGITIEKTSGNNPSIIVNKKPAVLTTNANGITISPTTQSAYDELQDKDANTLYIITE